ncbi:hypothetical protein AAW01_08610 [Aurantiacibacter gangjinensis]|uniref:M23ase beta-sheet core domain-containing protein n=1 Tax=Aurantiacibacter gangjinensis TaxID=502682 RepID=A0A0G9MNB4_9SPHN|nr:hypothetical protein AAW01_08610 [Aurantiacibacter gangjinensis]
MGSIAFCAAAAATGQNAPVDDSPDAMREALADALQEREAAERRSARFEEEAAEAENAAQRAAREAAALAARIQQAEAGITAARARMAMIDRQQANLREELGREQQPVVELIAALQQASRRPLALSVMQPGSVKDIVYLRAILHNRIPQVQAGTRDLRTRLDRARELRRVELAATEALRAEEAELAARREELAEIETRERLAARSAGGSASREAERALALAEEARDLDGLVDELDRAAALRERLAALPGPRLRPARPEDAQSEADAAPVPSAARASAPTPYVLPVAGRTVTGFGAPQHSGLSRGLTLAPIAGAQVVSPAAGRVVFAGPYRGYGRIVIVEHRAGWTSLITGLARVDVNVGDDLVSGSPLGTAASSDPRITLELRQNGEPVNPLSHTR